MTGREIDALVRALLGPYPRAFIVADGVRVPVTAVEFTAPGPNGTGHRHAGPDRTMRDLAAESDRYVRFPCRDGEVYLVRAR